jgi:formyl-CoA transferase
VATPGGPRRLDFQNLHRNKRSTTLNLKSAKAAPRPQDGEEGRRRSRTFAPTKARFGIDYKDLKKVNPRIVYGSISGFGQTGPTRTGWASTRSRRHGRVDVDHRLARSGAGARRIPRRLTGLFCALGIMTPAARDQKGSDRDVASQAIFMLDFQAARWLIAKEVATGW